MNEEVPKNANGIAGKPLAPTVDANGNVLESLHASQAITENPQPARELASVELHKEESIPTLRTYQSDIADAMKEHRGSVATVVIAEQKRHPQAPAAHVNSKKSFYILVLSILLIIGSGMAFAVFTLITQELQKEVQLPQQVTSQLMTTEYTQDIMREPQEGIVDAMKRAQANVYGSQNALTKVQFFAAGNTAAPLTSTEFLLGIGGNIPAAFIRALDSQYEAGFQLRDTSYAYIVLTTSSYEQAFAGMLAWEQTMLQDLANILPSTLPPAGSFVDNVVKNKDVRVVYDTQKTPLLMYTFTNKNSIIITTHEETLKEIITRLTTSQFIQ